MSLYKCTFKQKYGLDHIMMVIAKDYAEAEKKANDGMEYIGYNLSIIEYVFGEGTSSLVI